MVVLMIMENGVRTVALRSEAEAYMKKRREQCVTYSRTTQPHVQQTTVWKYTEQESDTTATMIRRRRLETSRKIINASTRAFIERYYSSRFDRKLITNQQ